MKSFILIAVLAALTVNDAASVPNEADLYQEEILLFQESGEVYQKDYDQEGVSGRILSDIDLIQFYEYLVHLPAIPNTVLTWDVHYRGNSTTRINRIRITNPPTVPGHTHVTNMQTYATVRLVSQPGVGLHSFVSMYGHYAEEE